MIDCNRWVKLEKSLKDQMSVQLEEYKELLLKGQTQEKGQGQGQGQGRRSNRSCFYHNFIDYSTSFIHSTIIINLLLSIFFIYIFISS